MIFVIERVINDYREKMESWQRAYDEWVADDDQRGYRSEREYIRKYPRPYSNLKIVARRVATAIVIAAIAAALVGFVSEIIKENNKNQSKHPKTAQVEKPSNNCQKFNLGDHVRIQYGDYVGDTGKIVGGCSNDEDYQIKIDHNQTAYVNSSNKSDVSDHTISVAKGDNLVTIKE